MVDKNIKIVGFCCNWCCYGGADNAGTSRMQYPSNIRIIRVMCSGRVNPEMIFKAFHEGADGVFVGGCHLGDCHYDAGNYKWRRRAKLVQLILDEMGINRNRFRFEWVSASEGSKFQRVMNEFSNTIQELNDEEKNQEQVKAEEVTA